MLSIVNGAATSLVNTVEIRPYTPDLEPSVKAFNARLREGGESNWKFPESHVPRFPKENGSNPYQEFFLSVDGGQVRGGYLLTHSDFAVRGETVRVACGPQLSLSEGIVNRFYGMVGVVQVQDAVQRQPLMYALGMGGMQERLPQLLQAMGWTLFPVPMYFKILNASAFLANIRYLRSRQPMRYALDFLRYTGLGTVGVRVVQVRPPKANGHMRVETFSEFGDWADTVWNSCRTEYSLIAARDSRTLNRLYPTSEPRFLRLRVAKGGQGIGWAVMLDTKMSGHKQFGDMRVGSIVDCLAEPAQSGSIASAAARFLEQRGVDIIVSNQASSAWGKALASAGFLPGPSNFILGLAPLLVAKLQSFAEVKDSIHMNRGDGDGPINL